MNIRGILALVMMLCTAVGTAAAASQEAPYCIGAGDVLAISVWKDESLTRQVVVLPDGTISFPLIGRIAAEGLDLDALTNTLRKRLSKFVPDPILSVEVQKINSLAIYVIGKVNRPGRHDLADKITVLQALALAGGLTPFADDGDIKIFRKTDNGTRILAFDYDDVSKGKALDQNIVLERGDVIVVR